VPVELEVHEMSFTAVFAGAAVVPTLSRDVT
jgi:hypothetical protein